MVMYRGERLELELLELYMGYMMVGEYRDCKVLCRVGRGRCMLEEFGGRGGLWGIYRGMMLDEWGIMGELLICS